MYKLKGLLSVLFALTLIAGCAKNPLEPTIDTGVRLHLFDTPPIGDVEHIYMGIVEVAVRDVNGVWHTHPVGKTCDFLELINGVTDSIDIPVDIGSYDGIRIVVARENLIVVKGTEYPLNVPSTQEPDANMVIEFDVSSGNVSEILSDFHVAKSVTKGESGYSLNPSFNAHKKANCGTVSGKVLDKNGIGIKSAVSVKRSSGADLTSTISKGTGYYKLYLPEDSYELKAEIVDDAGNILKTAPESVTVMKEQETMCDLRF
ncbi:DUF4382 domain-containing protein [candidate division WOR-3 bacterium]|nr:DUF4382 domain-containing protein [candidate division WOR-3 bacterium]